LPASAEVFHVIRSPEIYRVLCFPYSTLSGNPSKYH